MTMRAWAVLAAAASVAAACSDQTPAPTPESQRDAAAASAPAGTAVQRPADGTPATEGDESMQTPTADVQGHNSEQQAPQLPR